MSEREEELLQQVANQELIIAGLRTQVRELCDALDAQAQASPESQDEGEGDDGDGSVEYQQEYGGTIINESGEILNSNDFRRRIMEQAGKQLAQQVNEMMEKGLEQKRERTLEERILEEKAELLSKRLTTRR